jgi:colanic acid/amylovoran biosynthesis glycosyltransferase
MLGGRDPMRNKAQAVPTERALEANKPLNVCVIVNTFPKRSEVPILNQVIGLIRSGHSVTVLAESEEALDPSMWQMFPSMPVQIRIPVRPLSRFRNHWLNKCNLLVRSLGQFLRSFVRAPRVTLQSINFLRFGRHARSFWLLYQIWPFISRRDKFAFDIVHAQYGPNGTRAVLLRQLGLFDAPVVTSFRGYDVNKLPRESEPDRYKQLFAEGDLFTTDSQAMASKLIALGCDAARTVVIPSSVDLDFWRCREVPVNSGRRTFTLLTAARLVECKGIRFSLEAVDRVQRCRPELQIRYIIAGDGPLRADLKRQAADCAAIVEFAGWVNQSALRDLMVAADVFLLPSIVTAEGDEESQGLVLQEAQASGVPVIASDIGGIAEGMIDGETGILVREQDIDSLEVAILRLADDPELRDRMGACSRSLVESRFSLEQNTRALVTQYRACRLGYGD